MVVMYAALPQPSWWSQDQRGPDTHCFECRVDLDYGDHVWWCGTFPDGCERVTD